MKRGFVVLVLVSFALPLRADSLPLPAWDDELQTVWWTRYPSPDKWPQAVEQLKAMLEDSYKKESASAFSNPDFQGWLDHLRWIQLGLDCPDVLARPDNLKTFIALGKDVPVSHLFIEKITPRDFEGPALLNLIRLAQANLDDLNEYAALGVAYSLVFDQPFPRYWPHPQVAQSAVPIGDLDIVQRFNFYVQANRDKKLEQDLTQLTFEQLKFVVDSEVKLPELTYAQSNKISYSTFEQAFSSITYDDSRMKSADGGSFVFNWRGPTYTLADIEKTGGICVDQAYYATLLGKGRGIPTLYFQGQGLDGGHAWFGYMSRSGTWNLDCGRYVNQNFPKGYARDPQTWQVIDDTILNNLFKNGDKNPNYQPARTALAWARLHDRDPLGRQILDDARALMPELAETWEMEAHVLQTTNASDDDQKTFYQNWITQFGSFLDMKVEGQTRLLALLKKNKDPEADQLQQDIILQNRGGSFDQGIQGVRGAILDKIHAGDWDGARHEFEDGIQNFGSRGGGTFYYGVIAPYIENCLKDGRSEQAAHGLRFAEERMTINSDSILGDEFAKLKAQVDEAQKKAASSSP